MPLGLLTFVTFKNSLALTNIKCSSHALYSLEMIYWAKVTQ